MTTFSYTLSEFTPSEAERITGTSTTLQRDWRRREYLPANEDGHARFNVHSLAELLFLKSLSDRGIGPHHGKQIADIAAGGIAIGALLRDEAYEGDQYPIGGMNRAVSVVRKTSRAKVLRSGVIPARFLIIWADGTEVWHINFHSAVDDLDPRQVEQKLGGPVTIVDQYTVGHLLCRRAGRPLVHVKRRD